MEVLEFKYQKPRVAKKAPSPEGEEAPTREYIFINPIRAISPTHQVCNTAWLDQQVKAMHARRKAQGERPRSTSLREVAEHWSRAMTTF